MSTFTITDIPEDIHFALVKIGLGDPRIGLINLVNSYESAMEQATSGEQPDLSDIPESDIPALNLIATRNMEPPLDIDGLVNWDYCLGSGQALALELEMGEELSMPEYDRRKKIIQAALTKTPENHWGDLATREEIEGKY